jgi:hypothetical protein
MKRLEYVVYSLFGSPLFAFLIIASIAVGLFSIFG